MKIPLVDLAWQREQIGAAVEARMRSVIERGAFILGSEVAEFEAAYAAFCGVDHCVGVANGTDGLELGLRALDIGPGDEVVVPTNSFIASALAILRVGATPVLVDVSDHDLLVTAEAMQAAITERTRALMPVDLYGQIPDLEAIESLAAAEGLAVVQDAAQAQGAVRAGRRSGAFGDVAGVSFYPAKNIGAWGDAGCVVTRRPEIAARIRALRNYGGDEKYLHPEMGFNSRLDTLQACVLLEKLLHLDAWNAARAAAADRYDALLEDVDGVRVPGRDPASTHVWHIYGVRVADRDRVLAELQDAGIGAGIHYPLPIHLQGALRGLGHREGDFPVAEAAARELVSLPLHPGITEADQIQVVDVLTRALRTR